MKGNQCRAAVLNNAQARLWATCCCIWTFKVYTFLVFGNTINVVIINISKISFYWKKKKVKIISKQSHKSVKVYLKVLTYFCFTWCVSFNSTWYQCLSFITGETSWVKMEEREEKFCPLFMWPSQCTVMYLPCPLA